MMMMMMMSIIRSVKNNLLLNPKKTSLGAARRKYTDNIKNDLEEIMTDTVGDSTSKHLTSLVATVFSRELCCCCYCKSNNMLRILTESQMRCLLVNRFCDGVD
jgi:hypothetical protein